jgi:hypothetical protein
MSWKLGNVRFNSWLFFICPITIPKRFLQGFARATQRCLALNRVGVEKSLNRSGFHPHACPRRVCCLCSTKWWRAVPPWSLTEEPHQSLDVLSYCQEELLAHEPESRQTQAPQSDLIPQFRELPNPVKRKILLGLSISYSLKLRSNPSEHLICRIDSENAGSRSNCNTLEVARELEE